MSEPECSSPSARTISGRWLVVGMFIFGLAATGTLYAYWTLHLMPFMPLQEAIVQEFPGSAPRVDGGKKRMSENTPTILRIVMKSQIDPLSSNDDSIRAIVALRTRVAELAIEKVQLEDLAIIELHVYKLLQEKEIRERSWRLELESGRDWYEVDQRGESVVSTPVVNPNEPATSPESVNSQAASNASPLHP